MFKNWEHPGCGFIILLVFIYVLITACWSEYDRHEEKMHELKLQENAQQMYR
jgi:hypothetical protein